MNDKFVQPADIQQILTEDAGNQEGVNTGLAVFQFKIQLRHTSGPVWRRVLVPDDWSFTGMHAVVQAAFEWQDKKLHSFSFRGGIRIETESELQTLSDSSGSDRIRSENMTEISDIFAEFDRGIYIYDLEENWEHEIIFEKVLPREPARIYPCCIKARGAAPSEENYTPVPLDLDSINVRLAVLMPKYRKFLYRNPYEWRLYSCLNKQKTLTIRSIGKYHKTRQWSKLDRESLISAVSADILNSLEAFINLTNSNGPSYGQILCYLLARHHSELPFELERYQECFDNEQLLFKIIDNLEAAGYVFKLEGLDCKQLPLVMREAPDDFYPVLIMPAEVKKRCLKEITDHDLESRYLKSLCQE